MAPEDAVATAALVVLSGTLVLLATRAFQRYRNRSFLFLIGAFVIALTEGVLFSLWVFGVVPGPGMPLFLVAGVQVAVLVLIYGATVFRE
jgi:hypothetical protein